MTEGSAVTNYSYDQNNNLVKVVKPNGDVVEYKSACFLVVKFIKNERFEVTIGPR